MNTQIVKISDDQNEITHESGVVTVFVRSSKSCNNCIYVDGIFCYNLKVPCMCGMRKDKKNGIFKLKHNAEIE